MLDLPRKILAIRHLAPVMESFVTLVLIRSSASVSPKKDSRVLGILSHSQGWKPLCPEPEITMLLSRTLIPLYSLRIFIVNKGSH